MSVDARGGNRPALTGLRQVVPVLVTGVGFFGTAALPMLHLAPNRLVVGTPITAVAALGNWAWLIAAFCLLGSIGLTASGSRLLAFTALTAFSLGLVLFAVGLGAAAADLVAGQPTSTRARPASGAWIGLASLSCGVAWAAGSARLRGTGGLTIAAFLVIAALLHRRGAFDGLSLVVEYRARAAGLHAALLQHLALAAAATLLAAAVCALLYAWRPGRGAVEIVVNGLQVVPAVALLGGLVALTSAILAAAPGLRAAGVSALGPTPALLAITAYLLLPFWRGLQAALRATDPAVIDAATALSLSRRQILLRLRLPLGAPLLIGALRVACVQSIGLATLGALVGAGGLGGIVFDGMAQFAPDLILIGAIPVVALSLIVERTLSLVEDGVRRRVGV